MQETYENCPVCGSSLNHTKLDYSDVISYGCNNEKKIIFAKAAKKPLPEYHSFSYTRTSTGRTTRWMLQFNLSPKKVIRLIRDDLTDFTDITDRYGMFIMRVEQPLEPDFPSLEKLRNKIKTCINFS